MADAAKKENADGKAPAPAPAAAPASPAPPLEEDDEFEEFETEEWPATAEAAGDAQLWEDEWDDDDVGDDFMKQLRDELQKSGNLPPTPAQVVPPVPVPTSSPSTAKAST